MGARKKKSPSSPQSEDVVHNTAQGQIVTSPEAPWWQRTWVKVTGIGSVVVALLGAPTLINNFVQGSAKLPDTYALVSAWVRGDKHFVGEWTNDVGPETEEMKYSVGPPLEGLELRAKPIDTSADQADQGAVSLKLEVKDGLVTGDITSRGNTRELHLLPSLRQRCSEFWHAQTQCVGLHLSYCHAYSGAQSSLGKSR